MVAEIPQTPNPASFLIEQAVNVRKRKWLVLAVSWAVCLVGWAAVMTLPQTYQSQARAIVDESIAPFLIMKGFVVDTTSKQDAAYLQALLLSRPVLEAAAVRAHLVPAGASAAQRQAIAGSLASRISVAAETKTLGYLAQNVIDISYSAPNPVAAKKVLDVVLEIFAEKIASNSRLDLQRAQAFVNKQIAIYQVELRAADKRRADFRQKYAAYFDVNNNIKQPQTLLAAAERAEQDYQEAVTRAHMLHQAPPVVDASVASDHGLSAKTDPRLALAEARRHLAELELVDTDNHPDVILAKQTIAELEAEVERDGQSASGGGAREVSNPAYGVKLADAQADVTVLAARRDKAVRDYNDAKAQGANLQKIAAMQADLNRDFDARSKQFDNLVKIRDAANFSAAASDQTAREQFRVIDPPNLPGAPNFPDRLSLFSIVLVLGIVAGVLSPMVWSLIRPTFASAAQLRGLGLPVIGTITLVKTVKPAPVLGYDARLVFVAASIGLIALYGGLVLSMTAIPMGT
jgi:polysaccharide chain length determinant protein (PEP-CTERM system associated)